MPFSSLRVRVTTEPSWVVLDLSISYVPNKCHLLTTKTPYYKLRCTKQSQAKVLGNTIIKKRGDIMKKFLFVLVVMGLVFSSGPVLAKDGFYIGGDLGIAVAPEMDMEGTDNDYGTICDKHINRTEFVTFENQGGLDRPPEPIPEDDKTQYATDCSTHPPPSQWFHNGIDGGTGLLAGVALGYRLGSFRVEGEYFYRGTTYDSTAAETLIKDKVTTEKFKRELETVDGAVDDVLSHNFFANLYYDYRSDSKFTPYVGFGVGFSRVSLDYYGVFARRGDPKTITTFSDVKDFDPDDYYAALDQGREPALQPCQTTVCEDLNRNIAGKTTIGRAKLSDTLFGYQVIAGVDYQVSEPVSIGLKFRWADFGEFEDGREWDQLRSHPSTNLRPGDPVRYKMSTNDIQFWGVSLNMKYQF